jgi:GNAT superfamily N-acetyltransferase
MAYDTRNVVAASRYLLAKTKSACGANAQGGGGFQPGNTCASGDSDSGGVSEMKTKLKNGTEATVKTTQSSDDDDQTEYDVEIEIDGKRAGRGSLILVKDGDEGYEKANFHPSVESDFRRQGIATEMYLFANGVAERHGVSVEATDDLSDGANLLWEKMESDGLAKRFAMVASK